jgi:AraC-like DNA-binding protein
MKNKKSTKLLAKTIYKRKKVCYNEIMANEKKKFYTHKIANLLNVQKIVTIHYQSLESNYSFPEETHDFWEINYADKEDLFVGLDNEKIHLKQGEMLFIKPNQPHFVKSGEKEPNLFIVSFVCHSTSMQFFCDKKFAVPEKYRYLLQNIMSEAVETFNLPDFDPNLNELKLKDNPNLGGEQVIKNALETLFIYLLRQSQNKQQTQEFFVSKIEDSTELQDEIVRILSSKVYDKFRLEDLREQLHYGTTQLCTFFKKKTGRTIYQTYLKLKIDEAKRLIRKKISFADITDKLCFDSVSTFTFVFKKHVGMTPNEYRNSIK